ncbi:TPA: ThiF family adenylyltransferase [Streptococcus equi subsp. zooepidemicus]|nr:ThiF family adenylyltransferase [Streptococcus equi subsp. zooepidemicus]
MNYSRPCIKDIYPIYKLSDTMFRIGAQINITTEFNDPTGELWELVTRLNGTELNIIFKEMKELFPNITLSAIEYGIDLLANEGLIEEFGQNDSVDDRYMSNVNYFRRYLDSYEDSLAVQKKINNSSILLLGLGGGGSNILTLLAGLEPKKLTIVDYDRVERNNLGRQMLYKESDIGELKTVVAKREFEKMNSSVKLTTIDKKINSTTDVLDLLVDIDLVICAIDEPPFVAQRRVNEAIIKAGVPCVFGGSQVSRGRVYSVVPGETGCFDCLNIHYTKTSPNFIDQFVGFQKINFNPPTVAYGPAIFQLSGAIVDEAIRILTNFCIPMSKSTQFEINYETGASFTHKPWPRFKDCPTCGHGNSNDWEIFSHYG